MGENQQSRSPPPPSEAVVEAVATREGVDSQNLVPRLSDAIDPEALDSLFADRANDTPRPFGRITFLYCGYEVTVHSGGTVDLDDTPGWWASHN